MSETIHCPTCNAEAPRRGNGGERNFCSPACRTAFNARAKVEGAAIVSLAKAWRAGRGSGNVSKAALQELCAILDELNRRDREEGRPPVAQLVERQLATGIRFMDRTKGAR